MELRMLLTTEEEFESCLLTSDDGTYSASYDGYLLHSVFQPIFNRQKQAIGYEALLRIFDQDNQSIRPDLFFTSPAHSLEKILNIERLSRVIHIRNFALFSPEKSLLFLNVLPESAVHFHLNKLPNLNASLLESRIRSLHLSPERLVFELLEFHYKDEAQLLTAIEEIKLHGFNIAIDDFGSKASCEHRVSLLKPGILKIDRQLLLNYEDGDVEPLLSALKLAHKEQAFTVIEGVETSEQYQHMKALGIDYFQGFLLGKPLPLQQQRHIAA